MPSPYPTLDDGMHLARSNTKEDVYFNAMALQMDWPTIPIMTTSFGILTICAGISLVVLIHRGFNYSRLCLLLCILTMYGATAAYWTVTIRGYSAYVTNTVTSVMNALRGDPPSERYAHVIRSGSDAAMHLRDLQMCTGTAALLVNITLGDGIVWWRAWVICGRKMWVLCLAAVFLLGTASIGITETTQPCSDIHYIQLTIGSRTGTYIFGALFLGNMFGLLSSMVTLLTNVVATGLIGYQAWVHRRMVRECHLNLLPSRVGVRALLALLIESGALYCIVWAFVVAFEAALSVGSIDIHAALDLETHAAYTTFCMYLMFGALVPLIAIYPTVIIILVTLGNSCFDAAAASACNHGASSASLPRLFIPPTTSESQTLPLAPVQPNSSSSVPTPIRTSFSVDN